MIEVNNLVKRYGSHLAVDHLSFRVEEGQIYGFLGPNGAGKSTTMNIMTGYLGATEGDVRINGHNILEEPDVAKRFIGYLPEIPPLYIDMTVWEYLNFAAELKKIPKADRAAQIEQAAALTKLTDMMPRLIKNLSKGYKQRVGLAQAILGFPPVIILDEPTVGLDPKQIIEIRDLIKTLAQTHTVILSSHILQEVSAVCDHVMIISHGKLVASDTPENLEKLMRREDSLEMEVKGSAKDVAELIRKVCGAQMTVISEADGIVKCHVAIEADMKADSQADNATDNYADDKTGNKEDNKTRTGADTGTGMERERGGRKIREALFYAFADARMPILSMAVTSVSLEDIFLELTDEGQNIAAEMAETEAEDNIYTEAADTETGMQANDTSADQEADKYESDL